MQSTAHFTLAALLALQKAGWRLPKQMLLIRKRKEAKQNLHFTFRKQNWLVMKLTAILLLSACLQVSATGFSQNITLSEKNVPLQKVFKQIHKQTGYQFFYEDEMLNKAGRININVKDAPLETVLAICFKDLPLSYSMVNNAITVTIKKEDVVLQPQLPAINNIHGTVKDEKGNSLAGVSVIVKGTAKGTSTGTDGSFSIDANVGEVLEFTMVGYQKKSVVVGQSKSFTVVMEIEAAVGDEVVVVGYGTQKKIDLTGAVSQVSGKVLDSRAMVNIGQGLQGQIGNLNVTTNPGDPGTVGQGSSFNIRGNTSINGGSPLILIDGVSGDPNNLNPDDVESVTVLKDAASSAIYGARATYGVILITTKQGSNHKTLVSFNSSITSNSRTNYPKTVNSLICANVMNEAASNAGSPNIFSPKQIDRIKEYMTDPKHTPTTVPDPTDPTKWSYGLGNANVNYFKLYYKDGVLSEKNDLALSGGSGTTTYRVSLGYLNQDGILRFGKDNFNRFNVLANLKTSPKKWLRFNFQTLYSRGNDNEPYPYSGSMGNWFHTAYTRQPQWPVYDPNGHPMWTSQIQFFEGARDLTTEGDLSLKGEVEIEPIKGWKINARYAYNNTNIKDQQHSAILYAYDVNNNPYQIYSTSSFDESSGLNDYNSLELFTSFDKKLGDHSISFLLGGQMEANNGFNVQGSVLDLVSDQTPSLNTGTGLKSTSDALNHWANLGSFMRFNYNYKEKYLFEFNGRTDGTSKFPSDKQWGFFPSASVGYNIAKEDFFRLKDRINELKLRASYGSLGNQQVANYLFYNTVNVNNQLYWLINGQRPNYIGVPGIVSSDLTWETAKTLDFGLDMIILKNRLNFSFDWYKRSTLNMIGSSLILPATLGTPAPKTNNADMVTHGFELNLGWNDVIGANFQYNLSFNLSDYTSKIIKYNNPNQSLSDYYKGMTIGEIWGYKTDGLIQTSKQLDNMADQTKYINANPWQLGDVEYKDLNGDKVISPGKNTLADHGDLTIIGNNTPRYQVGFNAGFVWKRISFNMFWQGVLKRDYWLSDIPFFGITGSWTQQIYHTTLNYWSPKNTGAYFAKPYATSETTKNQLVSSRYLQNAAYLRLKNVQIGYTLSESSLTKLKISKIMVFLSGENLFYISKLDANFDPEVLGGSWGNGKTYPLLRRLTGGIKVEF